MEYIKNLFKIFILNWTLTRKKVIYVIWNFEKMIKYPGYFLISLDIQYMISVQNSKQIVKITLNKKSDSNWNLTVDKSL